MPTLEWRKEADVLSTLALLLTHQERLNRRRGKMQLFGITFFFFNNPRVYASLFSALPGHADRRCKPNVVIFDIIL